MIGVALRVMQSLKCATSVIRGSVGDRCGAHMSPMRLSDQSLTQLRRIFRRYRPPMVDLDLLAPLEVVPEQQLLAARQW